MKTEYKSDGDVVVVGGGPAGVAAAVQLARYGIATTLYEVDEVGGLVRNARRLENLPGFPAGIAGPDFARHLTAHLKASGTMVHSAQVERLEWDGRAFGVAAAGGPSRFGVAVVASGTRPRRWDGGAVPAAADGRVRYDVASLRGLAGMRVVVIGGGDAAFDYALTLASAVNDVVILDRGAAPSCIPPLRAEAAANAKIDYRAAARVEEISAANDGLCVRTGGEILKADYVVFAIGREPRLDFLGAALKVKTAELQAAGRLYFVGDVKNGSCRQAVVAAGDGVRAAMAIAEGRKGATG